MQYLQSIGYTASPFLLQTASHIGINHSSEIAQVIAELLAGLPPHQKQGALDIAWVIFLVVLFKPILISFQVSRLLIFSLTLTSPVLGKPSSVQRRITASCNLVGASPHSSQHSWWGHSKITWFALICFNRNLYLFSYYLEFSSIIQHLEVKILKTETEQKNQISGWTDIHFLAQNLLCENSSTKQNHFLACLSILDWHLQEGW